MPKSTYALEIFNIVSCVSRGVKYTLERLMSASYVRNMLEQDYDVLYSILMVDVVLDAIFSIAESKLII